jgi:hypothetical protein
MKHGNMKHDNIKHCQYEAWQHEASQQACHDNENLMTSSMPWTNAA